MSQQAGPGPGLFAAIRFDADGLVPAIAQQHDSGEVLMLAWMNRDAIAETLATGRVCYWSRSRGRLWRKGESSGQVQHLRELRIDCDGDTVLLLIDQTGVACHTGRRSCFYRAMRDGKLVEITTPLIPPETLYPGRGGELPRHGDRPLPPAGEAGAQGAPGEGVAAQLAVTPPSG